MAPCVFYDYFESSVQEYDFNMVCKNGGSDDKDEDGAGQARVFEEAQRSRLLVGGVLMEQRGLFVHCHFAVKLWMSVSSGLGLGNLLELQ